MGGASADEAAGHGEAEVGAVSVGGGAGVPAGLSGGVEDQDVHHVVQVALDQGPVLTARLVGPLDAAVAPVRPVDVVLVLGESEGVGEVIGDHLAFLTWKTRKRENQEGDETEATAVCSVREQNEAKQNQPIKTVQNRPESASNRTRVSHTGKNLNLDRSSFS